MSAAGVRGALGATRGPRTAAFLVVVALLAWYAATQVRVGADFAAFLPAGATAAQRTMLAQLREGTAGRLLLIELAGAPPERLAQASRALAMRLSTQPRFRYAANGDAAQAKRDFALVQQQRYVLSPGVTPERFSAAGLRASLDERLEGLYGSAAPLEKELLARDPTGETLTLLRTFLPSRAPRTVDGVWFDATGQRALLVAETAAPASDLAGQQAAVEALRAAHAALGDAGTVAFSSPGALAVESRTLIARQARWLSVTSAVLIVGVLAWTYRSAVPVLLCIVPAVVGLLAGVCVVHAMLGRLNGITIAFAATLLGEAVDYPSFLFTQTQPGETPADARRRIGPVLRLAVLTTACGGLALLTSGFPGLIELGLLTITGILVAGMVTWWVIPAWVPDDLGARLPVVRWSRPIAVALAPRTRWLVLAGLIGVVIAIDATRTVFDDDLAHLNPLPAEVALRDRQLRDALGAPDVRSLIMIRGTSDEDVLERAERLRPMLVDGVAAGQATGFDLVSDYLPAAATQARRRAALPQPEELHANLAAAVGGTPFRLETFTPFEQDVERARAAAPLTARDLAGTALGLRVSALLGRDADGSYAVVPLRGVADAAALRSRVAASGDAAVTWVDLREEAQGLLHRYRQQALVSTAFGIALIFVVLGVGLRDSRRALVVTAPVIAATLLAAGLLVAAGVPLTIFHVVALLLVVGTGVNYALFAERAMHQPGEAARTVRTLLVVSGTTLCAFATLAASTIPVLRALGTTVCVGVVATLLVVAFTMLPTRAEAPR